VRLPPLPPLDAATGRPGTEAVVLEIPGASVARPGSRLVRAEVAPPPDDPAADALGLDSRRALAMAVRDRIRVLAWAEDGRGATLPAESYLRAVYERWETDEEGRRRERNPLYDLRMAGSETALADDVRAGEADLVVLANVAPRDATVEALLAFVRGGGALLVFVGNGARLADPAALNVPFHASPDRRLLPFPYGAPEVRDPATEPPFLLDLAAEGTHPLAAPFTGDDAMAWIGLVPPAVRGRLPFVESDAPEVPSGAGGSAEDPPSRRVVLRFADEARTPAVVEGRLGAGRALFVATSLDDSWLERGLPFFLPVFLDEAAVWLTRPDEARRNLEVGRRLVVSWLPRDAREVRFVAPGGTEAIPTRFDPRGEADRPTFVLDRVGTAGAWRLLYAHDAAAGRGEGLEEWFAVNPDPTEGRLLRASDGALAPPGADLAVVASWGDGGAAVQRDARAAELARLLLGVLLGLLLVESILAWAFGRSGRTAAARAGA